MDSKIKKKIFSFIKHFLLIFYALISIYPLIWMVLYSFKNNDEIFVTNPFGLPKSFAFTNYLSALNSYNVPRYLMNSMFVTTCTVIFVIILSLMFAYAVSRLRFKGQLLLKTYITLGMFIPVQVIMIPLAILVKNLNISNTYWAVIVPYVAFNLSFASIVFYGFFRSIPIELEESACIDGASIYKCFFSIILPVIKPAIATVLIFVFLQVWNEFTMALILISDEKLKTLPLGLLFFQGEFTTDWGAMGAAMVIASIPTVLIYILFSEQVEKAMTVGSAVKG